MTMHHGTKLFIVLIGLAGILWVAGDTAVSKSINFVDTRQVEQDPVTSNGSSAEGIETNIPTSTADTSRKLYDVVKVIDGDTLDVSIDGKTERIRLIGINTPEIVDPRKLVECFGVEASNKAKEVLVGKKVFLEADSSQGERDKYGRLLRYVFTEDGAHFNLLMIQQGFAYEYTYNVPYKYQVEFKEAQRQASASKAGLWADSACQGVSTPVSVPVSTPLRDGTACTIKGNISSSDEKIFHVLGCGSYEKTVIDEGKGERWFCTEEEALAAGWRKALNCE